MRGPPNRSSSRSSTRDPDALITTSTAAERNGDAPRQATARRSPKKKKTATPARTAADRIKLSATVVMGSVIRS